MLAVCFGWSSCRSLPPLPSYRRVILSASGLVYSQAFMVPLWLWASAVVGFSCQFFTDYESVVCKLSGIMSYIDIYMPIWVLALLKKTNQILFHDVEYCSYLTENDGWDLILELPPPPNQSHPPQSVMFCQCEQREPTCCADMWRIIHQHLD